MPRNDRMIRWLLLGAALLLMVSAGLVWGMQHRRGSVDARYRAVQDSLVHVTVALRDSVAALDERYRIDTVRVRETTVVYRAAAARVDTLLVTAHGDSVRLDTVAPVKALVLACQVTIAARDSALSACDQRMAVARRLFVTDSARQGNTITYLQQTAAHDRAHARAQGRRQGVIGLALTVLAASLAWRALPHS